MRLLLFKNDSPANYLNKKLTPMGSIDIKLKRDVDKFTPNIPLTRRPEFENGCNYVFIDGLNRYYFVESVDVKTPKMIELSLKCDVLSTFKDSVLALKTSAAVAPSNGITGYVEATQLNEKTVVKMVSNVTLSQGTTNILTTIGTDK